MLKSFSGKITVTLLLLAFMSPVALATQDGGSSDTEPENVQNAGFQSRCENVPKNFPPCADSPSECGSKSYEIPINDPDRPYVTAILGFNTPINCIFLQEPIGWRPGYDLFKITPTGDNQSNYQPWYGGALVGNEVGPVQAILAFEKGKEFQGPFGLLYNYLALVYNFLSGVVVGFVILIVIIGGIRISTAGADTAKLTAGKDMIIKALIGMILWFTASVILYTINPSFFAF